jgi:ATPase MipZ
LITTIALLALVNTSVAIAQTAGSRSPAHLYRRTRASNFFRTGPPPAARRSSALGEKLDGSERSVNRENAALDHDQRHLPWLLDTGPSPLFHRVNDVGADESGPIGFAHVVVLGNEKSGSSKSNVALHVAVAVKGGPACRYHRPRFRQQSFTRYINNRSAWAWARRTSHDLELPVHRCIEFGETMRILDNESSEFVQFVDAVSSVVRAFDFIVIDPPGLTPT